MLSVEFPLFLLYPLYTGVIALVMLAVVPREKIRRLVVPGIIYGGAGDVLWLLVLFLLNQPVTSITARFIFPGCHFSLPLLRPFSLSSISIFSRTGIPGITSSLLPPQGMRSSSPTCFKTWVFSNGG